MAAYYAIEPWQRAVVGVTYLGLAGLLAVAHDARPTSSARSA